jgi:hypothetical protein
MGRCPIGLHPERADVQGERDRRLYARLRRPRAQRLAVVKNAVYAEYDITKHFNGRTGEVDHLVSLELGGTNARANLFPEAAPGSHQKDRLENALHGEVCDGTVSLRRAQREIAGNWVAAYRARFGRR